MTARITCVADLQPGIAGLSGLDPRWAGIAAAVGEPPLRLRPGGFAGLLAIVVGQQVSVASARAILARCERLFDPLTAERIATASDDEMRLAGLSRPKQRTLRALAGAILAGALDLDVLADEAPETVRERLCAISGIGPWTADVYALFCLGHGDGFAAGDLALQEATRIGFALPARPRAAELAALAEGWRPWRGTAARLLWAYYALLKRRDGV